MYFCILHLDIRNGKTRLQENSTDFDIIGVLEEKGVPRSDIVPGIQFVGDTDRIMGFHLKQTNTELILPIVAPPLAN